MPDQSKLVYPTLWDFVKNPIIDMPALSTIKEKLKIFISLFLLGILLAAFLGVIILGLGKLDLTSSDKSKVQDFINHYPKWIVFAVVIVFSPIIEELFFRLHLRLNEKYMHINFIIIISGVLLLLLPAVEVNYIKISILTLGVILLLIYFIKKAKFNQFILTIWNRNYFYVFYISVASFGLLHITNYNPKLITFLLLPILVLPQLILGLFIGYIRLRLGFFLGCIFHVFHNFIFFIPIFITVLVPASFKNSIKIVEQKSLNDLKVKNYERFTNDTIEFNQLKISDIIAKLSNVKKEYIEFEDSRIADKILTINFARGAEVSSGKLKSSGYFVLSELLRKYNLKIEQKSIAREIYQIQIVDSIKLNFHNQSGKDTLSTRNIPVFYDNEIILHNSDLNLIAQTIDLNYGKEVVFSSKNHNKYTIKIPKLEFEELNQFLTNQYGIKLNKSIDKVSGYKISATH